MSTALPGRAAMPPRHRVEIVISGPPVSQGSLSAYSLRGGGVAVPQSPKVIAWRRLAQIAAHRVLGRSFDPWDGPVEASILALARRPRRLPRDRRGYPATYPDADKIARAVLDAFTGIVYRDDGQIVDLEIRKRYAPLDVEPSVLVTFERITGEDRT